MTRAGATRRHANAARRPWNARPRWRRSRQALQPRPEWADDANPLTRRGCRSNMTEGRRSPILPFCGNSAYRVGDPPREPQDPSPPLGPAVGGPPTLLHPTGVRDSVTAIDDRIRIGKHPPARPSPSQDLKLPALSSSTREARGARDTQPGPLQACAAREATEAVAGPRGNPGRDYRRSWGR